MACPHPFPCTHGPAGPPQGLREMLGMEPGAGPTKCSGPRPRLTAAKPRSLSPFWFCHFRKHSFLLGGGDSAAPRPCPVTPPPPGRARAGSPSHPSQAGPHSLTSSQTPARRPEGEGPLLAGQGALSAWWWGVPAARALPQRQGELAWLCEVSAAARPGADVVFGATCAAFWGADGHRPLLTATAC